MTATDSFPMVCPMCDQPAVMNVKGQWSANGPDFDLPVVYTAAQCSQCLGPVLYSQEWLGQDQEEDYYDDLWQMYPAQQRGLALDVPEDLRQDFDEAQRCLKAKSYRGAAVLARRVIEGICDDHGEKKGVLKDRLVRLQKAGVIDKRLFDWADACREVGNEGAHERGVVVTREDAEDLLGFVEALADYLYVYRARFDKFAARRAARAKADT